MNEKSKKQIIARKREFPSMIRPYIDAYMDFTPCQFLSTLKTALLSEHWLRSHEFNGEYVTVDQVEIVVRFFPEILSTRHSKSLDLPIRRYLYFVPGGTYISIAGLRLVPTIARLGVESHRFKDEERGGLLSFADPSTLSDLVSLVALKQFYDDHVHSSLDETILVIMKELRRMNLLKREDIQTYDLPYLLLRKPSIFPIQRFFYLIHWDPPCLERPVSGIYLIQHSLVTNVRCQETEKVPLYQQLFSAGMQYFPTKIGFLFHKNKRNAFGSAHRLACSRYGRETVAEVVDHALNKAIRKDKTFMIKSLIHASCEARVEFDCVYTLIRKQPDMVRNAVTSPTELQEQRGTDPPGQQTVRLSQEEVTNMVLVDPTRTDPPGYIIF